MQWFGEYVWMLGVMMIGMFFFWGVLIIICFYLMKNYINGNKKPSNHIAILKG